MGRLIRRILLGLVIAAAAFYAGDWAVWRIRMASGTGMGRVEVDRIQVAALKGNKEEYYADGTADVDCSRSLFPQGGANACWWMERHRVEYER